MCADYEHAFDKDDYEDCFYWPEKDDWYPCDEYPCPNRYNPTKHTTRLDDCVECTEENANLVKPKEETDEKDPHTPENEEEVFEEALQTPAKNEPKEEAPLEEEPASPVAWRKIDPLENVVFVTAYVANFRT